MQHQIFNPIVGVLPVIGWTLIIMGGLLLVVAYNPILPSHPIIDFAVPQVPSAKPMVGASACLVSGLICLVLPHVLKRRAD